MKPLFQYAIAFCAAVVFALVGNVSAQEDASEAKTLSPYFFVLSDDPDTDSLPLKSTRVSVDISGVIADVSVTQGYENAGRNNLEAIYVFPASSRAAVYAMKMTIGERTIMAKIKERERARQDYEQAKAEGKSASLLEQHRPNVFQMNVANILPGDVIEVEMKYTEPLVPADKVYEFVYPTVVGPRYAGQAPERGGTGETWTANPYLKEGEAPTYAFDIGLNLAAGIPIRDVVCSSHKTKIDFVGRDRAKIELDPSEKSGGNRDFILRYRLAGDAVDTGLLISSGKDENFFLLMVQPPENVKVEQIPPREYIFIVDVSGSMHGFPLDISKELLRDLIGSLRPTDVFNVLLFAGSSSVMAEKSLPATSDNIRKALDTIDRQQGGGGTEILPALERALALPRTESVSRTVVIATDGYVNVETETFDLIRNRLGEANMFAFGIGSSVNRFLLEGVARAGMGEPFVITKPTEAKVKAEAFRKLIATPVMSGVKVDFGKFEAYDVEPPSIPDVLADRPVIVFGKWRGKASGSIKVTGKTGGGDFEKAMKLDSASRVEDQRALANLWARRRIAVLSDYENLSQSDERKKTVTDLGLRYSLLTAYTSFVAVDSEARAQGQKPVAVDQPLPLPEGVSNLAVGGSHAFSKRMMAMPQSAPVPAAPFSMSGEVAKEKTEFYSRDEVATAPEEEKMELNALQRRMRIEAFSIDEVKTEGGISEQSVKAVLEKARKEIALCLNENSDGGTRRIEILIYVDAEGKVSSVKIAPANGNRENLEGCLAEALKKAEFGRPSGTAPMKIGAVLSF